MYSCRKYDHVFIRRLDLSQAEAVMDVIQAKNEYALKSSMSQLKGSVQKTIKEIRSDLIYEIAFIESALKSAVYSVNSNLYKQIHTVGMLTCHASVDTLATPSQGNLVS